MISVYATGIHHDFLFIPLQEVGMLGGMYVKLYCALQNCYTYMHFEEWWISTNPSILKTR